MTLFAQQCKPVLATAFTEKIICSRNFNNCRYRYKLPTIYCSAGALACATAVCK
jgi:hypothetical protein